MPTGACGPDDWEPYLSETLRDGSLHPVDDVLAAAAKFLGPNYREEPPGSGRFVSEDGCRQVRMGDTDITGQHGGGPHANFETLRWNPVRGKNVVEINRHIFIN